MLTTAFLLVQCIITLVYFWLKRNYSYWKRNKVCGPKPSFLVGNIGPLFTFSEHWAVVIANWYRKYPNEPYIGYYKLLRPAIVARDPDLIKDILVTNFNSFRHNDLKLSKKYDPLTAINPYVARDAAWSEGRKIILPVFSPNNIRSLMPIMNGVGEDLVKFIRSFEPNDDIDVKDLSLRYTTENVVKCVFSIDAGCFNKQTESEFLDIGRSIFAPSFLVGLKFLAMPILPQWAMELIPVPFVSAKVDRLFRDLVSVNKASRFNGHQSTDIFQMLLKVQAKHNFDETFLAGHAMALYVDGTETSSTILSYVLYELALNPHCQIELYKEISENITELDGKLTTDGLQEMNYLEGVLFEALRKYPALITMTKVCTKPYTLPKINGQSEAITLQPGTIVSIPMLGIHRDPKYYPQPEKFMPERFSSKEQRNRHKGVFLGFGEGPRACLGMRFAIAQLKISLVYIVRNFHIKMPPNQNPIDDASETFLSNPKNGIRIQFKARN